MMPRHFGRQSRAAGLPPGTPVHIGERKVDQPKITLIQFDENHLVQREPALAQECFPLPGPPTVSWLNVDGLHDIQLIETIATELGLHPLVLEDILNTDQRTKLDDHEDYLFIVAKMVEGIPEEEIAFDQLSLVVGPHWVASFQELPGDIFDPIRDRLKDAKGRIRRSGPDYVAYSLLDAIVDGYFGFLEQISDRMQDLEESLVQEPSQESLQEIHSLRRDMVWMRRSVWPLRETISSLERSQSSLIQESTHPYLRDVYDHTIQAMETIETFRDMLTGMLDMYLSSNSNQMNVVMKLLTIIGTIFIPLTFIVGVYGMNFHYMPELGWRWGYPAVWLVMLVIAGAMVAFFRRRGWL